jgi:hypothetical protein
MNVYEMYVEHGKMPGFWLRRTTWGNTCAKVTSVGELKGRPPYYGNPEVRADIYDLYTGDMKEAEVVVPVPGTYKTWRLIQPPAWSSDPPFDPSAGRVRLYVPFEQNDTAKRLGARWSSLLDAFWLPEADHAAIEKARAMGFLTPPAPPAFFRAPYERRAEISALGGRWHSDLRLWSLPSGHGEALAAATAAGFERVEPTSQQSDQVPPEPR